MDGNQPWYASKTVWGGIVALLAGVAAAFGYVVDEAVQVDTATAITAFASAIGGLVAVYGRIKATKKIGK